MRLFNGTWSLVHDSRYRLSTNFLYWCLLLGGCAVFLLMNFYTPVKEEDLFHAYIGGGSGRPIDSLMDALRSWVAYYHYDARLENVISFTFTSILGKKVFNMSNTLVFGIMVYLLIRVTTGRNSAKALVILYTYMVTSMPVSGETLLWATAAYNYLWAFTASLMFIAYLLWHRNAHPGWLACVGCSCYRCLWRRLLVLPVCHFPHLYQCNDYLIFPIVDVTTARLEFSPYSLDGTPSTSTVPSLPIINRHSSINF